MYKPIPKEIKEQILSRIKNEGIPVSQAAKDHGINVRTIYGWLSKGTSAEPGLLELNRLKKERDGLYQLVGKLTAQLNKQKKGRY